MVLNSLDCGQFCQWLIGWLFGWWGGGSGGGSDGGVCDWLWTWLTCFIRSINGWFVMSTCWSLLLGWQCSRVGVEGEGGGVILWRLNSVMYEVAHLDCRAKELFKIVEESNWFSTCLVHSLLIVGLTVHPSRFSVENEKPKPVNFQRQ